MEHRNYDLVILGGGTGGYVAAISAAQQNMRVAVVERAYVGGTCLHRGCIPSKALLKSASMFQTAKKLRTFGIETGEISYDWSAMYTRKNEVVQTLFKGVNALLQKNGIEVYSGEGTLLGPSIFSPQAGTVSVDKGNDEFAMLTGTYVLLATGSRPVQLQLDENNLQASTSDDVSAYTEEPNTVVIVGGGVIGVEWASFYAALGKEVTILEVGSSILPREERELVRDFTRALKKQGISIRSNVTITAQNENSITIASGDKSDVIAYDLLLQAAGRIPNTENIGIENTKIQRAQNGRILTNEYGQTAEPHIYAIGDCAHTMQLAHVAMHSGMLAVEHMNNKSSQPMNNDCVPRCIYSFPELASIGVTEEQLKEENVSYRVGKFAFRGIGKAVVNGETDGWVKILTDEKTDDLLGVHIIGANATEMIGEMSFASFVESSGAEIAAAVRAHPSLNEVFQEAARALEKRSIHS
ncbi:MAG: dihydrolipoyl dehydrogenase [Bacilli bacterium]